MAIKIKKKVDRPESNEPAEESTPTAAAGIDMGTLSDDDLFGASANIFDWISDNRQALLGAVGVAVVGLVVWGQVSKSRNANAQDEAAQLFEVYHVDMANVGEGETYESLSARAEAVVAAADGVTGRHVLDEAALMAASSELLLGEADAARGRYETYLSANTGTPEAVYATMGVAAAQAAAGQLDPAIAALDQVEGNYDRLAPQVALYRARLLDTYGEPADALEAYRSAMNAYPDDNLAGADQRVAQLEVLLGAESVEVVEEAAPEDEAAE